MKFLDQAKIFIRSGNGGPGSVSFRREANVPYGGPDGGNGGRGGDIIAKCVNGLNTLIDFRYQQHFKAESGHPGAGRDKSGLSGNSIVLKLPVGTQILSDDQTTILADLTEVGQEIVLIKGGEGGRGNAFFKSSTNQAPRRAQPGILGLEMWIWLRLKLIADAGLVGLPNAGKSTFLSIVSAAKPKIADYPFTTLHPNLGVVAIDGKEFVMADIPGLIDGAHEGAGIGHRFLGHVERCSVLLHLIDVTHTDPIESWRIIRAELSAYDQDLANKPEIVALSKCDSAPDDYINDLIKELKKVGAENMFRLSSITGHGLNEVLRAIDDVIQSERIDEGNREKIQKPWQP